MQAPLVQVNPCEATPRSWYRLMTFRTKGPPLSPEHVALKQYINVEATSIFVD